MATRKMLLGMALIGALVMSGWTYLKNENRYTFNAQSKMRIEGTSTVHDWTCEVKTITGEMTTATGADIASGGVPIGGRLVIPVSAIDCGNGTMQKKMRDALKASTHNTITYELVDAKLAGAPSGNSFKLLAKGKLTIAGKQKPVDITLNGQDLGGSKLRLQGSYPLLMSDFGIDPPTAMLGTLKTGNKVVVHFDIVAEGQPAL